MPRTRKSWREKLLDAKGLPKIGRVEGRMIRRWGAGTMVIPAPIEVDALMKRVPRGKVATIDELRAVLASAHRVNLACPLTTGIFAWIAAHAADEAEQGGKRRVTPYWRVLKSGGELNAKYPGGIANLRARLAREGHRVVRRGQRHFVVDYERALARLEPSRWAAAR
jgi:alkylated DNA nucleotide flippase Atl1